MDALARLAGNAYRVIRRNGELVFDLRLDLVRVRGGKVNLVDGRNDIQIGVHRQVGIRYGLRLDALRRVHDQNGAFAGGKGTRDLVGEVYVAGGVDKVKLVSLAIIGVIHDAHGVAFNGDAALAFDIHGIEQLRCHIAFVYGSGEFKNSVADSRLAVVDMSDNREIPDM